MPLREIGTEFWHEFPVFIGDSRGVQERFLYKIIAHAEDHKGNGIETIHPIRHQMRRINGINFVQLSDRVVQDYTFAEWEEVQ